jgi:hypothetical protein
LELNPQAQTVPSVAAARACELPPATTTIADSADTATAVVWAEVVVPFPSCPELPRPHDLTAPDDVRPKEVWPPAAVATMFVRLLVCTGAVRGVIVVPSPASPKPL